MGLLSNIFGFLESFDMESNSDSAKRWGDDVWDGMDSPYRGELSFVLIDDCLYKQMRIKFRNGTVGIFSDSNERDWHSYKSSFTKTQQRQLMEEGRIVIKRY